MTKLYALPTSEAMLGHGSSGHQSDGGCALSCITMSPKLLGKLLLDSSLDLQLGLHIMVSHWFFMGAKALKAVIQPLEWQPQAIAGSSLP